ncbi:MAG TPA: hypothetical protein VLQ67_04695 [Arachnia sp.]|nr:hypothetical protein [Arachnia sp.]
MNTRPNVVLAVVIATVALLAVMAGVFTATREQPDLDPSTPDGVVQLYALALIRGDDDEAVSYLDPSLGCSAPLPGVQRPLRAGLTVADTRIDGDKAIVVADITESQGGLLDTWEHREQFELRTKDGEWMLTGHPWPVYGCK